MNELGILGLILVIVGVVMAPFAAFTTLILVVVGILLLIVGGVHTSPKYTTYPMFTTCLKCNRMVEVNNTICPHCQNPLKA